MRPLAALALLAACAGPRALGVGHAPEPADEGKRINGVRFEGVHAFDPDKIIDKLGLRGPEGIIRRDYSTFESLTARLDAQRIAAFYAANGYFSAIVPA